MQLDNQGNGDVVPFVKDENYEKALALESGAPTEEQTEPQNTAEPETDKADDKPKAKANDAKEEPEKKEEPLTQEELKRRLYQKRKLDIVQTREKEAQELAAERQRVAEERAAFLREREELAAYRREVEALKRVKAGDAQALREAGLTDPQLWRTLTGETAKTEEQRLVESLKAEIANLKGELSGQLSEVKKRFESEDAARQTAMQAVEQESMLRYVANNEQQYPHVFSRYDERPQALVQEIERIADEYRSETGRPVKTKELLPDILEFLENSEIAVYNKLTGRKSASAVAQTGSESSRKTNATLSTVATTSRESDAVDPSRVSEEERVRLAKELERKLAR